MRLLSFTLLFISLLIKPLDLFAADDLITSGDYNNGGLGANNAFSNFEEEEFLPVEQAYVLNVEFENSGQLRLNWQITPGYYLYRHGFEFTLKNGEEEIAITPSIPSGIEKEDEYFGEVEVYYHNIDITLGEIPDLTSMTLTATSQGCADAGLCYPPYSQHFEIDGSKKSVAAITDINPSGIPAESFSTEEDRGLLYILILAILGGSILNLMPCVFPVLSLKVLGFANDSDHSQTIHGTVYTAGVVLSFVAVAAVLVALQTAGEAIGWGFQLQSPWFVAALTYLFFVMGLSLSGYIEFGSQWMNTGGKLAEKSGYTGSFFTGVLATVVASPCTAPFMGTALGFAVTQSAGIALLVFAALGFGMALPVLILSCTPSLLSKIPKPGPWMDQLKQFLAFPLYATAVWLCWVVGNQTGVNGMAALLLGCVLIALAIWFWEGKLIKRAIATGCAVSAIAIVAGPLLSPSQITTSVTEEASYSYSPALLEELRKDGKPVFINVTADWCITCLANEKTTLSSNTVKQAIENSGITYLKADWTNRNADITALLKQYGRTGIPLYIVYGAGNSMQGELLPQILTIDTVVDAINKATDGDQISRRD